MKASPLQNFAVRRRAFTLIELLVVISIIAVLAGILLPVTGSVMENARKTSAKSTESQIVTAVKSFQSDYGVYPALSTTTANNDTTVGGTASNAELFRVLRATDAATGSPNTRRIPYFEGKDVKTPAKPKDGFATTGGTGNNGGTVAVGDLVDPWGNVYFVRYDSGYTEQVNNPYAGGGADDGGGAYTPTTMLRTGVISWSYGKDGKLGKNGTGTVTNIGDDVLSWQ